MIVGDVERVEIIVVGLGLGTDDDRKAVAREIRAAVLDDAPHGMNRAGERRDGWKGYVDRGGEFGFEAARFEPSAKLFQTRFHHGDGIVDCFARAGAIGCRKGPNRPAHFRYLAVSAEVGYANALERLLVGSSICGSDKTLLQLVEVLCQFRHRSSKAKRPVRSTLPGASKTAVDFALRPDPF